MSFMHFERSSSTTGRGEVKREGKSLLSYIPSRVRIIRLRSFCPRGFRLLLFIVVVANKPRRW